MTDTSAATSLNSALATLTFDSEWDDTATERQLGVVVNPDTAPIDASSNTRALSKFMFCRGEDMVGVMSGVRGVDVRTTYIRRTLAPLRLQGLRYSPLRPPPLELRARITQRQAS